MSSVISTVLTSVSSVLAILVLFMIFAMYYCKQRRKRKVLIVLLHSNRTTNDDDFYNPLVSVLKEYVSPDLDIKKKNVDDTKQYFQQVSFDSSSKPCLIILMNIKSIATISMRITKNRISQISQTKKFAQELHEKLKIPVYSTYYLEGYQGEPYNQHPTTENALYFAFLTDMKTSKKQLIMNDKYSQSSIQTLKNLCT